MPKRKHIRKCEEDLDHLLYKVRKLKRKMRRYDESDSSHSSPTHEDFVLQDTGKFLCDSVLRT